jgi:hypothetical protein
MNEEPFIRPHEGADSEFRHHLRDTLLLLGGSRKVADLLRKSNDLALGQADVRMLRAYNLELITATKERLANLNKLGIRPRPWR